MPLPLSRPIAVSQTTARPQRRALGAKGSLICCYKQLRRQHTHARTAELTLMHTPPEKMQHTHKRDCAETHRLPSVLVIRVTQRCNQQNMQQQQQQNTRTPDPLLLPRFFLTPAVAVGSRDPIIENTLENEMSLEASKHNNKKVGVHYRFVMKRVSSFRARFDGPPPPFRLVLWGTSIIGYTFTHTTRTHRLTPTKIGIKNDSFMVEKMHHPKCIDAPTRDLGLLHTLLHFLP